MLHNHPAITWQEGGNTYRSTGKSSSSDDTAKGKVVSYMHSKQRGVFSILFSGSYN
jgi:hypothetical protein